MKRRLALLAIAVGAIGMSAPAESQTARRPPQTSPSLFGIGGPETKADDSRNGRKRVIYDRQGRRDYRRDFNPKDEQKHEFCRLHPASNDCIGFRL